MCENEVKIGYKDIFKQVEYMKLIIANVINRFGDSVDAIAFTWLVYQITQSASWSAVIYGVNMLPSVIIQPFAGALVERMKKKRIMVIADAIRGCIVVGLVILYLTDMVNPYILMVFTFMNSSVEAFRLPAGMAFTPQLLEQKYYEFGTSLNTTLSKIVEFIGLGLAGVIIAVFGVQTSIIIDAITFFLSAVIISSIFVKEEKKESDKLTVSSYLATLKSGLDYVTKNPVVRNICLLMVSINAVMVPLNTFEAPLIKEVFKQGSMLLSVLGMSTSVGMAIGSVIFPYVSKKFKVRSIIVMNGIIFGSSYLFLILVSFVTTSAVVIYPSVAVFITIFGIAISMIVSVISVQFMKEVEQEYLSRTGAILNASGTAAVPIFSFLCTFLVKIFTLSQIFVASGTLFIILFLYIHFRKVQFEKVTE
ncbi:MFS transporter [Anaeromicropila herbilytica]|uniref:MFS transporter n=1 Tax=Anaeromicropila herbilytica TaxID=2785025 RepID=A0A7R7ELV5_9FIRM|nr:MFS transporter [Anaeromicropila herbilytica]BCN31182.1 MFS transporter [Anaeromicropila herbilytica]